MLTLLMDRPLNWIYEKLFEKSIPRSLLNINSYNSNIFFFIIFWSSYPHQHERTFSAHVSAKSLLNISPNPEEVIPKLQNPRTTFENPPLCQATYSIVKRGFVDSFANWRGERREREKDAVDSEHYVLPATSEGRVHTSLRPTMTKDKISHNWAFICRIISQRVYAWFYVQQYAITPTQHASYLWNELQ